MSLVKVGIIIGIILGVMFYSNMEATEQESFKERVAGTIDNIKEMFTKEEVRRIDGEEENLTNLGKPHKAMEVEFNCDENSDCEEYGEDVICVNNYCWE